MTVEEIIERLRAAGNPDDLEAMARFGITPERAFGTKLPALRKLARAVGRDHALAGALWEAGYRESRILASMVEEPERVTAGQMDRWAREFTYWEICDQCCMNLFHQLPAADGRAVAWSKRRAEQQRRAGFALMAVLALKDRGHPSDERFRRFLPLIRAGATDRRLPVKKAVSWALRNIGKRNRVLNREAVALAREIAELDDRHARWVARDVLRELTDPRHLARIRG